MPILDIYSKRQKKLRGEMPDVYCYDSLPYPLRVQILNIFFDMFGHRDQFRNTVVFRADTMPYDLISECLCREYGILNLPVNGNHYRNTMTRLLDFFLEVKDIENVIDVIELSFRAAGGLLDDLRYTSMDSLDNAIEELNYRFMYHGVGYSFERNSIVRIDSELIHSEVVRPALRILENEHYAGAQQEFLHAHEQYRKGKVKETLIECQKSIESIMKAICNIRKWEFDDRSSGSRLTKVCFDNQLIPKFWQNHFNNLQGLLESGVPVARNKLGAHGQGVAQVDVPVYIAGYALHMTAAAIVFLAEAETNLADP